MIFDIHIFSFINLHDIILFLDPASLFSLTICHIGLQQIFLTVGVRSYYVFVLYISHMSPG